MYRYVDYNSKRLPATGSRLPYQGKITCTKQANYLRLFNNAGNNAVLSRNVYRRQQENGAYLRQKYKITSAWRGAVDRWHQRHDYRFFKCPACRTRLRVPRGKGKINIVCRKCGTSFQRKT